MKVSIINLTYAQNDAVADTYERGLAKSIRKIEYPDVEWLAWDNGSESSRVVPLLEDLNPALLVAHDENIGVARAKNQLFMRASGDLIMSIDPDIVYPDKWVTRLVECHQAIPSTGLAGYYPQVGPGTSSKMKIAGQKVMARPWGEGVYGGYMFRRDLLYTIGYLYEGYGLYGHTARDFAIRTWRTGRVCYYVGESRHLGHPGREGDYRAWKKKRRTQYTDHRRCRYSGLMSGTLPLYVKAPDRMEICTPIQ